MKYSEKINQILHRLMRYYVLRQYHKKSFKVERKFPELFKQVSATLSQKHKTLWGKLGIKSGDRWLRLHVNLTGIEDYRFCPEDIFFACIERILNDCNAANMGIEDKNELWRYVPKGSEPKVYLRYVRGSFFDSNANWISEAKAELILERLQMDVVGKHCQSSGGNGVCCFRRVGNNLQCDEVRLSTEWIKQQGDSYIVQEKIKQDEFSSQFNFSSINTVRMMTLRCPWNGEIVVCRSMMRMGTSGEIVDNMMKGGLCVCMGDKGQLGKFAYDYDGKRYEKHPVSNLTFEGLVHPGYNAMVMLAKEIASKVPYYNLLSFDFVPREDGTIYVVEINATSQGITQLQYDFGPLFGEETERLVAWCAQHQNLDIFNHFRTWF